MLVSLLSGLCWVLPRGVFSLAWYASNISTELTLVMTNIYKKVLYLSSFYKRGDLALRIGLFYTAASLSGAFGGTCIGFIGSSTNANNLGLLARGLAEIGPRGGIEGWRWILIIEGLLVR